MLDREQAAVGQRAADEAFDFRLAGAEEMRFAAAGFEQEALEAAEMIVAQAGDFAAQFVAANLAARGLATRMLTTTSLAAIARSGAMT